MDAKWGHCMHCRFFGCAAEVPLATEEAYCQQPDHGRLKLTVFGTNGCTGFELRHGMSPEVEHPGRMIAPT
jgi:hypothetical protein